MRVPLSRVYRAFPELDKFSDEQCRAYVKLARRERRVSGVLVVLACIGLVFVMVPLLLVPTAALVEHVGRSFLERGDYQTPTLADLVAAVIVATATVAPPGLLVLFIRDRWLHRAVRLHLQGAHCPRCAYLLLGLEVVDDMVRCPECGEQHRLRDLGLAPGDILATTAGAIDTRSTVRPAGTRPSHPPTQPTPRGAGQTP